MGVTACRLGADTILKLLSSCKALLTKALSCVQQAAPAGQRLWASTATLQAAVWSAVPGLTRSPSNRSPLHHLLWHTHNGTIHS